MRTATEIANALRSALADTDASQPVRMSRTLVSDMLTLLSQVRAQPRQLPLTLRQREVLTFIEASMTERRVAPSYSEIAEHFGFQSLATVHEHLTELEKRGYIRRRHNEARGIELVPTDGPELPTAQSA